MIREKCIIVDIDGTLSNHEHRLHYITLSEDRVKKDWDSFFKEMEKDEPYEWCMELMEDMYSSANHKIVMLVTAREEKHREVTEAWLDKHNVPYDFLYMRADGDHRDDDEIKKEIYLEKIKPDYDIVLALDDRPRICRMWRSIGIPTLQVNDVEF